MMFHVLIFAVSACVVSTDFTCPDGKVTCADGKACCFQSGSGYSCCDKPNDTSGLIPGTPSVGQTYPNESLASPQQASIYDYCPFKSGRQICCVGTNCLAWSDCCNAITCCLQGFRCCGGGQWCCLRNQKCGPYYNTCRNGAMVMGVQGMAVMVVVALAAMKFAKK